MNGKFISMAAATALLLAACGQATPAPAPTMAPKPAEPTAAAKPTEAAKPAMKDVKDMKILVDMKGPGGGNPFWAAVEKGAKDAGAATGAQVTVMSPPAESDVPGQIAQIEDQIAKGVDGIAIAPTDPAALKPVLDKAIAKGVKVVFIDTKGTNDGVSFIGTNNESGAKLAAEYICKNLKAGDKVAILQGIITQSTGKARADGAAAGLKACGLNVVAERPADWDTAKAQAAMEDILTKNPDLKGVFGSNDNMALGAVQAIKNAKLDGKIMVVGFDANPNAADAVLAGDMAATIAQAPSNMGKFGVENVIKLIKGEKIDAVIDTGTVLVDKTNADKYGSGKPAAAPAGKVAAKDAKILVDMKGPGGGNPFWAAVEKGAKDAGAALGTNVTVMSPPAESDVPGQIAQIEDQIAKGVHGIAIAPTDPAALKPVLDKAIAKGVKVVFIDTKGTNDGVTFIGTNNEVGAGLAAEYICKNLKAGDKVAILQGIITQSTGKARADGAKAGLTKCGLNVVAERPADWDTAKAQAAMEDILTKNPDLKGVFGSNDNMALGAVQAIKNAKLGGKIMVVGFDANPNAADAVLAGDMAATIAQAPSNMGKFGVESILKLLNGDKLDAVIDTGTVLVDKSNAAQYSSKGAAAPAAAKVAAKDAKILVDMKGPGGGNPFWAAVEKGAKDAGVALGTNVTVMSPPAESDVPGQIAQIEDQIAKGVSGIAIAPTDPAALKPALDKAIAKGIPVVFIDTKGTNDGVSFIGTNNEVGAKLAGDYICKNLKPGDKVAILQGIITQSTGKARADGASAALKACGLNVVAERPADWDTAKAQAAMEDILTKNPDLKGVFGSNDNMALGAVQAIKNAKLGGKILVVGFDANPNAAAAVLAGDMAATIAQAPANMGKFGVEALLKLLNGEKIDAVIDTGTVLVDKSNAEKYK